MSAVRFGVVSIAVFFCLPAFSQNGWQADPQLVERLSKQRQGINYVEANVPEYTLPDPLKTKDGVTIRTAEQWPQRRAEILELFRSEVYGCRPGKPQELKFDVVEDNPKALDGQATLKRVAIRSRHEGRTHEFELILF